MPRPETVGSVPRPSEFKPKYDYPNDSVISGLSDRISRLEADGKSEDADGKPVWLLKVAKTTERARLRHEVDTRNKPDDLGFCKYVSLGYAGQRFYRVEFDGLQWSATDAFRPEDRRKTVTGASAEDVLWQFQQKHELPSAR